MACPTGLPAQATAPHPAGLGPFSLGAMRERRTEDRGAGMRHARRTSKITQWVWATILSHPLGTQLCRHLLLFSEENLRSQKRGEAPAGNSSKNRLHLRMFPREMPSLSAADGASGRQVVGARGCARRCVCVCVYVLARVCVLL